MNSDVDDFAALRAAWVEVSAKYEAYSLILPGDPLFVCRAADCDAYCCRTFSVSLGDREVERFELKSSLPRTKFLEIENGEPIYLPLAQPYLLARTEARCSMLGDNLGCTQYAGRPDACRMFPYQLLFIDENKHRDVLAGPLERARAIAATLHGGTGSGVTAFLAGHTGCPGFTGPPLSVEGWRSLVRETHAIQFAEGGPGTA